MFVIYSHSLSRETVIGETNKDTPRLGMLASHLLPGHKHS